MSGDRPGFGQRLADQVCVRGAVCLGIDPHPALLVSWGLTVDAAGVREFSRRALEAFGDLAAAVKPQVALYEEYGAAGISVLEETLSGIRSAGALSVADAKRGDIGSTMGAYARAWLSDASPLACDAVTVSPYLGVGSLDPAFELAAATGRGVFVLARTSNPEATGVQEADTGGVSLAQSVIDEVASRNSATGEAPGPFGVVVGATVADPPGLHGLRGPVLVPGVGAQGGTPADVVRIVGELLPVTLVNVSRDVLRLGPDPGAMRAAAEHLVESLRPGGDLTDRHRPRT